MEFEGITSPEQTPVGRGYRTRGEWQWVDQGLVVPAVDAGRPGLPPRATRMGSAPADAWRLAVLSSGF